MGPRRPCLAIDSTDNGNEQVSLGHETVGRPWIPAYHETTTAYIRRLIGHASAS
jgi:hypothetical protein